jgi:hypothetical protein
MPTSRTAHANRERETHLQNNNKAKPEQLKLSKTDLSMWPQNSRLLACKPEIGEALYYVKPALRVDSYFQVLDLIKLLSSLTFLNQLYSNNYNLAAAKLTNQARIANK